jgi:hypothetical protein
VISEEQAPEQAIIMFKISVIYIEVNIYRHKKEEIGIFGHYKIVSICHVFKMYIFY